VKQRRDLRRAPCAGGGRISGDVLLRRAISADLGCTLLRFASLFRQALEWQQRIKPNSSGGKDRVKLPNAGRERTAKLLLEEHRRGQPSQVGFAG
jgi:hypothetical protein